MHLSIRPDASGKFMSASLQAYDQHFDIVLLDLSPFSLGLSADSYLVRQYAEWVLARTTSLNMFAADVAGYGVRLTKIELHRAGRRATVHVHLEGPGPLPEVIGEQVILNQYCDGIENVLGFLTSVKITVNAISKHH